MRYFIDRLLKEVIYDPGFRLEQNEIAKNAYGTLVDAYKRRDCEVAMVTKLCDELNGKNCGMAKIYAKKVHGNASKVSFCNGSRETTKELADMAVITIATHDRDVVFEKIAFIQNKKESSRGKWKIDQDQLYLLTNFPTFEVHPTSASLAL